MTDTHPTILLIDDDNDVLQAYSALLQQEGYVVCTCSNPSEALQLLQNTGKASLCATFACQIFQALRCWKK